MKRVMIGAVILAVIIVMALRGCPRGRRSAGVTMQGNVQVLK